MRIRSWMVLGGFVTISMASAIAYGMASGRFAEELQALLDTPWARVTLVDLFLGFIIIGAWIGWREQSLRRSIPWWIALAFTGNLAAGIYLFWAARNSDSVAKFLLGSRT